MRSVGFVILNSSYASKCCHSKQFHEYFVCYNYRNDRIFFVATKQNVKDVLNKFIPQLVKVLPMEDAIFIAGFQRLLPYFAKEFKHSVCNTAGNSTCKSSCMHINTNIRVDLDPEEMPKIKTFKRNFK